MRGKIGKNVAHFLGNIYPCLELDEAASPGGKAEQGHQALGHNLEVVVVVYYVNIVAIGHGLLKKFWPTVIWCVPRTAGSQYSMTV